GDQLIPVHWGLSGQPDGYANKVVGLLAMPVLISVVAVIYWAKLKTDPRQENLAESASAVLAPWCGGLVLMLLVHGMIVFFALGKYMPVSQGFSVAPGILLLIVAGTLYTIRPNHSYGVRTRWTLSSDESWSRTNRLAGWCISAMGIGTIVSGLLNNMFLLAGVVLGGVIVLLPLTSIYSYVVWKHDKNRARQ